MNTKIVKVLFFSLMCISCIAQKKDEIETEKCIKAKIIDFFININRMDVEKKNDLNSIHILEIVEKRVLGYDEIGIYFCTDLSSHRKKYLLLKNNEEIKILNSTNVLINIEEITSFLKNNNISNSKSIAYLKECIEILDSNVEKIVDKTMEEQHWVKCNN